MAPIPVYTNSPITAAKPDGVTPKTASTAQPMTVGQTGPSAPLTSTNPGSSHTAGVAQPGAAPSLPYAPVQPTPTTSVAGSSPAPPQPGSAPISGIPPPPKSGERYQPPVQAPGPAPASTPALPITTAAPYPSQMGIPPPTAPQPWQQRGTSTATQPSSSLYGTQLPSAGGNTHTEDTQNLMHPSGYQQNANASELDRYQRSAIERRETDDDGGSGFDGVWGAAVKLAQQTGERLAAVENEVWKKINKE